MSERGYIPWTSGMEFRTGSDLPERKEYLLGILTHWRDWQKDEKERTVQGVFAERIAAGVEEAITQTGISLHPIALLMAIETATWEFENQSEYAGARYLSTITRPTSEYLKWSLVTPQEAEAADPALFDSLYGEALRVRTVLGEVVPQASREEQVSIIQKKFGGYGKPEGRRP